MTIRQIIQKIFRFSYAKTYYADGKPYMVGVHWPRLGIVWRLIK